MSKRNEIKIGDLVRAGRGKTVFRVINVQPRQGGAVHVETVDKDKEYETTYLPFEIVRLHKTEKPTDPAVPSPPIGQPYDVVFATDDGDVTVHVAAADSDDDATAIARTGVDGTYEQSDVVSVTMLKPPADA